MIISQENLKAEVQKIKALCEEDGKFLLDVPSEANFERYYIDRKILKHLETISSGYNESLIKMYLEDLCRDYTKHLYDDLKNNLALKKTIKIISGLDPLDAFIKLCK